MISSIFGQVITRQNSSITIETVSGVGYQIFIGQQTVELNKDVRLYTHHHIREDISDLYGFLDPADLKLFEQLLSVSGVGPKLGQTLLTTLGNQSLCQAIAHQDVGALRSVSGVGQKVAEKIILELKNKVTATTLPAEGVSDSTDLVNVLTKLGYQQREIAQALKHIDRQLPVEEQVKQALREISR